jgi:hypothetical protein
MEIHRSWSVSAVSLTIFTVVVFGLLAAVIVWSSKANAPADVASSPTGVLTLDSSANSNALRAYGFTQFPTGTGGSSA